MGVCAKFDLDKQSELQGKVDEKIERKKEMKVISKAMKERETTLQSLPLEITVGADGSTRTAKVGDLQRGANQHMIIVAGPRKACKDALIGANLMKMDFAMSNVLVVPYQTDIDTAEELARPSGGFGDRPSYETQPYIARPTSEEWDEYIEQEINDAVEQNGENVKTDGIALVVANNGSIIRRGVGTVPWRQMVQQLEEDRRRRIVCLLFKHASDIREFFGARRTYFIAPLLTSGWRYRLVVFSYSAKGASVVDASWNLRTIRYVDIRVRTVNDCII